MRLRCILAGVLLSILAVLAIVSIAQAEDGGDLIHGDLSEWFDEHFPRQTGLRNAIWDLCGPSRNDACLLNRGHVFLGMQTVDDDDAGAEAAIGKFTSTENPSGSHVTRGQLKGWIDAWLAFHAEGTVNAVAEAAAQDSQAAAQAAQAAAQAAEAAAQAADAATAQAAAQAAQAAAQAAQAAADAANAAIQDDAATEAATAAAQAAQAAAQAAQAAADDAAGAAENARLNALAADTTERLPYPEPTRTGETFQSHALSCGDEVASSCKYDTSMLVTCYVMSDGYVECDPGAR